MEPACAITGTANIVFFVAVVIIGKYLLVNLLVAVILHEFAEGDTERHHGGQRGGDGSLETYRGGRDDEGPDTYRSDRSSHASSPPSSRASRFAESPLQSHREADDAGEYLDGDYSPSKVAPRWPLPESPEWPRDYSLCCFAPLNPIRRLCRATLLHDKFDSVIIFAIICSSVLLAFDSPRNVEGSSLARFLHGADYFFTGVFFLEMLIKVVSLGFAFNNGAYLTSPWNQLDCIIVTVSLVVLAAEAVPELRPLRILRLMRVLRPLRLISRNAGMRLIITSLFKAMPAVSNVFGVVLFLQIVFAILGMQFFSGTMATCNNPAILTRAECSDATAPPEALAEWDAAIALRWSNPPIGSFDNFGESMRLLYVMSSADQWELPMWQMMGATVPGVAPRRNDFSPMALFPIAWMFFGFIFAINLFVGVVVDNFSRMQKEQNGSATMTMEQQQWAHTMEALLRMAPFRTVRPPKHTLRLPLYNFVNSRPFDGFITAVIVSNIAVMACDFWGIEQDARLYGLYERSMDYFVYVYYAECVLKLVAFTPHGYFLDNWCKFDFFLVCTSLIDQFATEMLVQYLPVPPMLIRALRVVRILRILRLLKGAKELRDLIITMILSFPSLVNVGSLLALLLFIYSVLGVNLFTFVAQDGGYGGLTVDRNFQTFSSSFLLLFQCLTGDGWTGLMSDSMVDESSGLCSQEAGDCGSMAAVPYFVTFQALGTFIFLNLVVAVILENFANLHNTNPNLVSPSELEVFTEAWAEFDPDATGYIPSKDLPALLVKVPKPLGLKGKTPQAARALCLRLKVKTEAGGIQYRDVIYELVTNNFFRSGAVEADEEEFLAAVPSLKLEMLPGRSQVQRSDTKKKLEVERLLDSRRNDLESQEPELFKNQESLHKYFALVVLSTHVKAVITRLRERVRLKAEERAKAEALNGAAAKAQTASTPPVSSVRSGAPGAPPARGPNGRLPPGHKPGARPAPGQQPGAARTKPAGACNGQSGGAGGAAARAAAGGKHACNGNNAARKPAGGGGGRQPPPPGAGRQSPAPGSGRQTPPPGGGRVTPPPGRSAGTSAAGAARRAGGPTARPQLPGSDGTKHAAGGPGGPGGHAQAGASPSTSGGGSTNGRASSPAAAAAAEKAMLRAGGSHTVLAGAVHAKPPPRSTAARSTSAERGGAARAVPPARPLSGGAAAARPARPTRPSGPNPNGRGTPYDSDMQSALRGQQKAAPAAPEGEK